MDAGRGGRPPLATLLLQRFLLPSLFATLLYHLTIPKERTSSPHQLCSQPAYLFIEELFRFLPRPTVCLHQRCLFVGLFEDLLQQGLNPSKDLHSHSETGGLPVRLQELF